MPYIAETSATATAPRAATTPATDAQPSRRMIELNKKFGFTADHVVERARALLEGA